MARAPLGARGHRVSKPQSTIKSCVAATYRVDCVAATQLFLLYCNSDTRAARTYGAFARAYYCQRCARRTESTISIISMCPFIRNCAVCSGDI